MRLGVALREPWLEDARLAEALGFDLVWVDERTAQAPLAIAAAAGAVTSGVRLVAAVDAGVHPVTLAEETAVADLATQGRIVLAVRSDDEALLGETVDVLFRAFAARPFRHEGSRWRVPAGLPEHEQREERVRVTPPPAQLEPTIWLAGTAAPTVAATRGLGFVAPEDPDQAWAEAERTLGPAAWRLRRVAVRKVPVPLDENALVAALLAERDSWGLDVCVLSLPPGGDRAEALDTIARRVRPRVQLDRLPPGLEQYWRQELG